MNDNPRSPSTLLVALLVAALLVSCESTSDPLRPPGKPVPFVTLDEARALDVIDPGHQVFLDPVAWESFWVAHVVVVDGSGNPLPPPPVDFQREMVLGVFWGSGFSGCRNLVEAIGPILKLDDRLEVWVEPLPDLGDCAALVYPIHLVATDRSDLPVVFSGQAP